MADNLMSSKERITEILKAYTKKHNIMASSVILEEYAEELLANGVIVPPCQIGQKVYDIGEFVLGVVAPDIYELKADEMTIEKGIDGALNFVYDGMYINNEGIGKTVFLTKEEAEEKLRECGNNGNL
jgi:hypothetical protein